MAEGGKDAQTCFFFFFLLYFELVRASQSYACSLLENTGEGTQTEMSQVSEENLRERQELFALTYRGVSLSCSACWQSFRVRRQSGGNSWAR